MKAMILAAGRGERLRPLTDTLPKPLVCVSGKPLIVYHIERLAAAGIDEIVINHAWLGEKLVQQLGDGSRWGIQLHYSAEKSALETGGGIKHALPLLGDDAFLVINGDVFMDDLPQDIAAGLAQISAGKLAHLWLVDNPSQHPYGDFPLHHGLVAANRAEDKPALTFSGMGLYHPSLFDDTPETGFPLAPLLRQKMSSDLVSGSHYSGYWCDVGTIERLEDLERRLQAN
ncbi:N-acetylmuramate alpha-1-phosphate uridylyltransferase MurU [Shewanella violacea]|uniref:Nucleotidyltransferase family protein n=1 Tax=Shewanella violacea (strain JCM 10179 / CIP 106290 / LMG 19151 / DSS12) TaxID=637905 RepID=D4ZGH4_SHEVD|nr:nucleotidyltransferase family protein [Shewanella violacea]BAJ00773.1 nucleotidyltransferase family protein [Shewanella violacea DSS12]